MPETYYLIRNTSGLTYWNYRLDHSYSPMYQSAIAKCGPIYVNRNGGWMPVTAGEEILQTVEASNFPPEIPA